MSCVDVDKNGIATFNRNVKVITFDCFSDEKLIKSVIIPNSVQEIAAEAFVNCINLEEIDIPDNVKMIGNNAFCGLENLKNVNILGGVSIIGKNCFSNCENLEYVNLGKDIKIVLDQAFSDCLSLKRVTAGKKLNRISNGAFDNCTSLTKIENIDNVEYIGNNAFSCSGLVEFTVPKKVKVIEGYTFFNCRNLEKLTLNEGLTSMIQSSIALSKKIKTLKIPDSVETLEINSYFTSDIDLIFSNDLKINVKDFVALTTVGKNKYIATNNTGYHISDNKVVEAYNYADYNRFSYFKYAFSQGVFIDSAIFYAKICKKSNIIVKDIFNSTYSEKQKIMALDHTDRFWTKTFNKSFGRDIYDRESIKNYPTVVSCEQMCAYLNASFIMGCFENDDITRQRANDFLFHKMFESNKFPLAMFTDIFSRISTVQFKKEFVDFFIKNYDQIIYIQNNKIKNFVYRLYENFDYIVENFSSNRGNQRKLAITIEKCYNVLLENKYGKVSEEDMPVANALYPFIDSPVTFAEACALVNSAKNMPHSIFENEKNKKILQKMNDIEKTQQSILNNLGEIQHNDYFCQLLDKHDPINLVLGKHVSCCAHILGAGDGIARSIFLHPDTQNFVVKNKNKEIVAKIHFFVDKKNGYMVGNAMKLAKQENCSENMVEEILDAVIVGVKKIKDDYNLVNPTAPITQINIGVDYSLLEDVLTKKYKVEKTSEVLKALDFKEYSILKSGLFENNWENFQFVLYKKDADGVIKNDEFIKEL